MRVNRICEALHIKHPIVQAGMRGITEAILAAAVSNAGGLGLISAIRPLTELREEICKAKQMTNKPFGVNIPVSLERERGEAWLLELKEILILQGSHLLLARKAQHCVKPLIQDRKLVQ